MPFIDVARAIFAYSPASSDELSIEENDLLYVLEKGEDDWWKVKKKIEGDTDGPSGLVPRNYLEEVPPISTTRTLYDYEAQTEEELSFSADVSIEIYDKEDPDWFLVKLQNPTTHRWEYGFVPSNYLDDGDVESAAKLPSVLPTERPDSLDERRPLTPPPQPEEHESPIPLSPSNAMNAYGRPEQHYSVRNPSLDAKFKTWEVEEIDSRKRRKKGTLGIGNQSIVWSCDADKTPVQQWPITSLIEYNTEKKHLFIELSSPPRPASFHFHTDSRAVAAEISDAIGELAGAARASGLREVAAASGDPLPPLPETSALAQRHKREDSDELPIDDGIKRGVVLYDFDAQGDDELGCRQDQIIEIIDDSHDEWWKCRAGNREGVVPASYIDVIKTKPGSPSTSGKREYPSSADIIAHAIMTQPSTSRRRSGTPPSQPQRPSRQALQEPDRTKLRTWTDRSGTYKVEAQFLGLTDGKIQLHKLNGVKISVPLSKMSAEDVKYVDRLTGKESTSPPPPKPPPDSEKPRRKSDYDWYAFFLECGVDYNVCQRYAGAFERDQMDESILPDINADTLRTLGVREGDILRIMKRLDEKFGRTGGRKKSVRFGGESVADDEDKDDLADVVKITAPTERKESLFSSGPGGALRNNTSRRGRPTTSKAAPDEVDGSLLSPTGATPTTEAEEPAERERIGVRPLKVPTSRLANYHEQAPKEATSGFDDDAWTVKQKQPPQQPQPPPQVTEPPPPPVQTGPPPGSAMHDLTTINVQPINQSLPPPLQPQPASAQISPQHTAQPPVNRSASVPPLQTAPQLQPIQPHLTGVPSQQFSVPAQATGAMSLNDQLTKLQIYRQVQDQQRAMSLAVPSPYGQQAIPYTNGFSPGQLPPQIQPLQQTPTGYMPNFLPPSQQNSQLGITRSFSVGLPAPLIPTHTGMLPQQPVSQLMPHRTGPANFAPSAPTQFQPQYPQQQPAFQPQQPLNPQPTGFMTQPNPQPSFQQQPPLQPQSTGFPTFLPPQQTGYQSPAPLQPQPTAASSFKPVSFGTTAPKPLVPTRTGRRANLSAASIFPALISKAN